MNILELDLGQAEWQQWHVVCKLLKERNIEINDDNELNDALVSWGNKLVDFKIYQDQQLRE